jgi:hypothetical protein
MLMLMLAVAMYGAREVVNICGHTEVNKTTYEGVSKSFRTESKMKHTLMFGITR